MDITLTAEEFMLENLTSMDQQEVENCMIEFAKYHVQKAVKEIIMNAKIEAFGNEYHSYEFLPNTPIIHKFTVKVSSK